MFKVGDVVKQSGIKWWSPFRQLIKKAPYPELTESFLVVRVLDREDYSVLARYLVDSEEHRRYGRDVFNFDSKELIFVGVKHETFEDNLWE